MKELVNLYKINSPSGNEKKMREYLVKYVSKIDNVSYNIDKFGNILITKGNSDTYPCVVAHIDEVHTHKKPIQIVSFKKTIIMGMDEKMDFAGIGADDKNGIWIALKCLQKFDAIKVAFFVQEETGCLGSNNVSMDFFKDVRFVLEFDRKNKGDLISDISGLELCSTEFLKAIDFKKFGYKKESGLMTDVYKLKLRGLEVSCVNMSCGYYEPHTDREYTKFNELENCLAFVEHIITNCTEVYPHKNIVKRYSCGNNGIYYGPGWGMTPNSEQYQRQYREEERIISYFKKIVTDFCMWYEDTYKEACPYNTLQTFSRKNYYYLTFDDLNPIAEESKKRMEKKKAEKDKSGKEKKKDEAKS